MKTKNSATLNEDALKADGFSAAEIASIREYVDSVDGLDNLATLVQLNGRMAWVCKTVALAIRAIRPEAYLGTASEIGMPQEVIDQIQYDVERMSGEEPEEDIPRGLGVNTRTKAAQLQLPIYKQGDDLGHCLAEHDTVREALIAYSGMLDEARAIVTALAEHGQHLEITQADTHFIEIEGPAPLVDELIEKGLLSPPFEDEEESQ